MLNYPPVHDTHGSQSICWKAFRLNDQLKAPEMYHVWLQWNPNGCVCIYIYRDIYIYVCVFWGLGVEGGGGGSVSFCVKLWLRKVINSFLFRILLLLIRLLVRTWFFLYSASCHICITFLNMLPFIFFSLKATSSTQFRTTFALLQHVLSLQHILSLRCH